MLVLVWALIVVEVDVRKPREEMVRDELLHVVGLRTHHRAHHGARGTRWAGADVRARPRKASLQVGRIARPYVHADLWKHEVPQLEHALFSMPEFERGEAFKVGHGGLLILEVEVETHGHQLARRELRSGQA